jgi:hypothetical protein
MSDPLKTYLNDHLAGARLAIDLLEAMRDRHKTEPLGQFAESILAEVTKDRDTLQQLADKIGAGPNTLKEFGAWLSEKASRMKLGGADGDFEVFEALEFLSLGIQGKLSLWHALQATDSDPRLSDLDLTRLIARAESQYEQVEARRLATAATALRAIKT